LEETSTVSEKLQKAVSHVIAAGYQLDKEAFDFLGTLSQTEDPTKLTEEAVKKIETLPEKPLFIGKQFLEEIAKETLPKKELFPTTTITEAKGAFHPFAKDIEADVKVIEDPTDKISSTGSVEEFLEYFQDRFKKLRRLLRQRIDVKDAVSIAEALKTSANSKAKVIAIITEKREIKGKIILKIEDLEANATVLVSPNTNPEVMEKARILLLDQVVCISAFKGRDNLLIAEDFVWPDIPQKTPQKAQTPVYTALISDLHVGSKTFMHETFNRFLLWLNGKFGNETLRNMAGHIKYVVIAGDIVDGIGVYPGQRKELAIKDIYKQYQAAATLLEQIPDYIEVIIIPGNHDAPRKALPQPAIQRDYAEPLYEARSIRSLGNPATISLHGVELLIYHGRSLDDVIASVPNLSFHTPEKAMQLLLRSRHLAPIYGERTPIASETQDFMVIERVPDIFQAGHVHVEKCDTYRGVLIVNSGAWQTQTKYQEKMRLIPTPGIVPVVNLQTMRATSIDFTTPA
jgi:DNA polymerase II small subunit